MFKKLFIVALLLFSFSMTALAAQPPTIYRAKYDLNIRSAPKVGENRIGYFKKGQQVKVKKILGNWCQVEYKKYKNAYAYCPFLKKISSEVKYQTYSSARVNLQFPVGWNVEEKEDEAEILFSPSQKDLSNFKNISFSYKYNTSVLDFIGYEGYKKEEFVSKNGFKFRLLTYKIDLSSEVWNDYQLSDVDKKFNLILVIPENDGVFPKTTMFFGYNPALQPNGKEILYHILNSLEPKNT
jgi:hypothetical protein